MNKRIVYFSLLILLSAFQCDEDEYVPDYIVEEEGLVEIEDSKTTFSVSDYIFINTKINNRQTTTNNNAVNLSDFIVSDDFMYYSLSLYKISPENKETPYLIENVQEIEGNIDFNNEYSFFNIKSPYKKNDNVFISKIGIKLTEPGDYLLKTGVTRFNVHIIVFDLNGSSSVGSLQLKTSILNADEDGVFRFTVE